MRFLEASRFLSENSIFMSDIGDAPAFSRRQKWS